MSNLYTEDLNIVKLLKMNIFQSSQMKKEAARHASTLFYQSWKFTRVSVQQENEQIWSFEIIQPI